MAFARAGIREVRGANSVRSRGGTNSCRTSRVWPTELGGGSEHCVRCQHTRLYLYYRIRRPRPVWGGHCYIAESDDGVTLGSGCLRYVDAVVFDDEILFYCEYARADGSHEPRLNRGLQR